MLMRKVRAAVRRNPTDGEELMMSFTSVVRGQNSTWRALGMWTMGSLPATGFNQQGPVKKRSLRRYPLSLWTPTIARKDCFLQDTPGTPTITI